MKQVGNLLKNSLRTIGLSLRFAPLLTLAILIITQITYIAPIYQAKLLGDVINSISNLLGTTNEMRSVIVLIVIYASITAFSRILGSLDTYLSKYHSLAFEQGLEIAMATKRAEIDLGHYENPSFQDNLSKFNRGMWQVINMVGSLIGSLGSITTILVSSYITTEIGWQYYAIIIITSLPLFFVELKFGNVTWHIWAENTPRQRLFEHLRYTFINRVGMTQTKLLQNSNFLLRKMRIILDGFRKDQYGVDNRRLLYSIGASVIAASGFGYVFYSISSQVVTGIITIGTMVFLVNILGQLVGSFTSLLRDIAQQFERNLYVDDFFKVMDIKPYIKVSKNPKKLSISTAPTIEFCNVSFKYDGTEQWILKDISFRIESGKKVALVGENGAGKSTLIKLLSRIYDPNEGKILINGIDLKDLDPNEWMSYLAILLQDYVGYDLSVTESISLGRVGDEINHESVKNAARLGGADSFIDRYKNKYHQQIGKEFEGGVELSKGQNQRLALARTIYRNGYVVILDEPTAAIDAKSEMEIFENMEKASGESTLILITHRFNTVKSLDNIIVLEHGKVQEMGTHKELMQLNSRYAEMFNAQAKGFIEELNNK